MPTLDAVLAAPYDLALRRRFVTERGDPARVRIIELEDELAGSLPPAERRDRIDERETLLARNAADWEPWICEQADTRVRGSYRVQEVELECGFVSHLRAWADRFDDRLDGLAATSCYSLALGMVDPPHLRRLLDSALLPRLRRLDLHFFTKFDPALALELLRSPRLGPLEQLGLRNLALGPELAEAIAGMSSLRSLALSGPSEGSPQGAQAVALLAASAELGELRSLALSNLDLDPKSLAKLLAADFVPKLERLAITSTKLGARGCKLLGGAGLDGLVELDLCESKLGKHAAAIVANPAFARLERLNLDATKIGAKHLGEVLEALELPALRVLRLGGLRLEEVGAEALANSEALARAGVVELSLAANALDDEGVEALAEAEGLAGIRRLRLDHNGIRVDGIAALAEAPLLRGLEVLDISHNKIQTKGAAALAETVAASTLRELDLDHNWIGNKGITALLGGDALAKLEHLRFGYENNFGDAGLEALCDSGIRLRTLISGNLGGPVALARYLESPAAAELRCLHAYVAVESALARSLAEGSLAPKLHSLYLERHGLDAGVGAALDRRFALTVARTGGRQLEFWAGVSA
jgi:hypothetical protein